MVDLVSFFLSWTRDTLGISGQGGHRKTNQICLSVSQVDWIWSYLLVYITSTSLLKMKDLSDASKNYKQMNCQKISEKGIKPPSK